MMEGHHPLYSLKAVDSVDRLFNLYTVRRHALVVYLIESIIRRKKIHVFLRTELVAQDAFWVAAQCLSKSSHCKSPTQSVSVLNARRQTWQVGWPFVLKFDTEAK